jgi:hypothetical protein
LLTLFYLGLASGLAALDPSLPLASTQDRKSDAIDVRLSEIVTQVKHWSAHCAELEKAESTIDTRLCWWKAATAIKQYTIGDHPLIDDVRRLRIGWLWRAVQLTLELAEPKNQESIDAQPIRQIGPDPARLAGPIACASIILSNYKKCLTAMRQVKASAKIAYPRIKQVAVPAAAMIDKKKAAKPKMVSKTKALAAPVRHKIRNKEIVMPAIVRKQEVRLPIVPEVQRKKNFSRGYAQERLNAAQTTTAP